MESLVSITIREGEALFEKAGGGLERGGSRHQQLSAYMQALYMKDPELYRHSRRVQYLATRLAQELSLLTREGAVLALAALFHDLGKLIIPDALLQKTSRLAPEEFELIKLHPACGALLLNQAQGLSNVAFLVYHHHERWDGGGYPGGLRGEAIPYGARILAVADAFEAMTSHRPYQRRRSTAEALEELRRCAGTQFDPVLVHHFCAGLGYRLCEQRESEAGTSAARGFNQFMSSVGASPVLS
jgi:polar amino acid transport system substrate-binding protein